MATAGSQFEHASVVFDVDYASGMSRADTIVSVFDSFGRLVLIGRDSNITDDRSGALDEGSLTDLARGSVGGLDPYIGPVEMPQGTYFVSVSSNARIPSQLNNPGRASGAGQHGDAHGGRPYRHVRRIDGRRAAGARCC